MGPLRRLDFVQDEVNGLLGASWKVRLAESLFVQSLVFAMWKEI
jgi:hypothetical protein